MSRARLALAVERASRELRRRQRLADTDTVEAAFARFMAAVFRAQGEAFGSAPVGSVRAAMARWDAVAEETGPDFTIGARAALRAAMTIGAWRTLRGVGAMEALAFAAPPATDDLIPKEFRFERGRNREFAVLDGTPFSLDNPRATRWLATNAGDMVRNVNQTTKDLIRGIVTGGVDGGWSSERIGKGITALFPAMAVGKPQQHIDSRAHGIAVTEMAKGYEQGSREGADRLEEAGLRVVKSWLTAGDERVDDACTANGGADEIALRDPYPSGDQQPPAHPYCRCTNEYRVLARGERPDIAAPKAVPATPAASPTTAVPGMDPRAGVSPVPAPAGGWTTKDIRTTLDGADGMAPDVRRTVISTFAELERDIPRYDEVLAFARTARMSERTYAKTVTQISTRGSRIEFNAAKFGPRGEAGLRASLASDVKAGFHPDIEMVKGTVDHEFGHAMHFSGPYGSRIDTFLNSLQQRLKNAGFDGPTVNSEYGRQDRKEWWAELFAEARSAKPLDELTPPARLTRAFLSNMLGDEAKYYS